MEGAEERKGEEEMKREREEEGKTNREQTVPHQS